MHNTTHGTNTQHTHRNWNCQEKVIQDPLLPEEGDKGDEGGICKQHMLVPHDAADADVLAVWDRFRHVLLSEAPAAEALSAAARWCGHLRQFM